MKNTSSTAIFACWPTTVRCWARLPVPGSFLASKSGRWFQCLTSFAASRCPPVSIHNRKLPAKPAFQTTTWQPTDEKLVTVGWFSIDQNHHVNNVAYVQWLLEAMDNDTLQTREIAEIDLVYRTESHWNDQLRVQSAMEAPDTFLHRIEQQESGKDVLLARSRWR